MYRKLRGTIAVATAAATLLAAPAPSHAIFDWLGCKCGAKPAPLAAPVVEAPVVTQTTVNYVPQTCYRTQYVTVPVTTYRPATGCDPCTGFPVTTMRPAICYVQQARLVPYTTYRAVLTSTSGGCAPVYGAAAYAPAAGCSGCSAAPAMQPYYNAAPAAAAPLGSAPLSPAAAGAPTLAPGENPATSSFSQRPPIISSGPAAPIAPNGAMPAAPNGAIPAAPNGARIEQRQKPIGLPNEEQNKAAPSGTHDGEKKSQESPEKTKENEADATTSAPKLINPGDRTTLHADEAVRFAVHRVVADRATAGADRAINWRDTAALPASHVAKPAPKRSPPAADDADGWRPSSR